MNDFEVMVNSTFDLRVILFLTILSLSYESISTSWVHAQNTLWPWVAFNMMTIVSQKGANGPICDHWWKVKNPIGKIWMDIEDIWPKVYIGWNNDIKQLAYLTSTTNIILNEECNDRFAQKKGWCDIYAQRSPSYNSFSYAQNTNNKVTISGP